MSEKLVRDNIPDIIRAKGEPAVTREILDEELDEALRKKLVEEVNEFLEAKNAEELADIMEVVYALGERLGVPREELERLRLEKRERRGGFERGIMLTLE